VRGRELAKQKPIEHRQEHPRLELWILRPQRGEDLHQDLLPRGVPLPAHRLQLGLAHRLLKERVLGYGSPPLLLELRKEKCRELIDDPAAGKALAEHTGKALTQALDLQPHEVLERLPQHLLARAKPIGGRAERNARQLGDGSVADRVYAPAGDQSQCHLQQQLTPLDSPGPGARRKIAIYSSEGGIWPSRGTGHSYSTIVQLLESRSGHPAAAVATRRLDDCLSIRDGALYVEECAAEKLAERFGTPLYVISEDQLRRNARRFQAAFATRWPGPFLLLPSIKANSCLALRRILNTEGTGCDVFGAGELEAALRTGTDPETISLNGPMKGDALLERAIGLGVRITLDSRAELERTTAAAERLDRQARIRVRFRPDLVGVDEPSEMSSDGSSIRDAVQRYKAGIPTEDLLAIEAAEIARPSLDVAGVMLHLGRHSAEPAVWSAAVDALAELLDRLRESWSGWTPRELDLGGGFPAPRDPFGRRLQLRADAPEHAPEVDEYAEAICPRLVAALGDRGIAPDRIQLELEPGRALYSDAGIHLATVGNVKRQTHPVALTWVETDSSDAYLADVNLEHNRWTCLAAAAAATPTTVVADVTGRSCGLDVIVADARLPVVEPGDILAFLDTGAYQDASASNFNALPRPGTILVARDTAELVRRHESIEEVFSRDLVPARLLDGDAHANGDQPWRVTGLDHVSVTSGELDRSLAFYCDLLGLTLRARGEAQGASEFEVTGIPDATVRWADLELPRGQVLELIEFVDPRGSPVRPRANDPGATHISLRVADIDAAHERLREAEVPLRSDPVEITDPGAWEGARCFYASDPDGVTIELIEAPDASHG
jgi:diaminopimelate decarboxylase